MIASPHQAPETPSTMMVSASRLPLMGYPKRSDVAVVSEEDIEVKERLGSGQFSTAFAVRILYDHSEGGAAAAPSLRGSFCGSLSGDSVLSDCSLSDFTEDTGDASQRSGGGAGDDSKKFALKRLRTDVTETTAVEHILMEAELLSKLPSHPNIVRLCGVSLGFWERPEEGFLVLERLRETLTTRLGRWEIRSRMQRKTRSSSIGPGSRNGGGGGFKSILPWKAGAARRLLEREEQLHRVQVSALGVAKALEHLHRHKIIYRDLKPSNIGFAKDGKVRLFDFGLARSLHDESESGSSDRKMSCCGSFRYMAPEVALRGANHSYGLSADVYSFGIVLWQICAVQKPFVQYARVDDWFKAAVTLKKRPDLRPIASPRLRELIGNCWNPDPPVRPSFDLITRQLLKEMLTKETSSSSMAN